MIWFAEKLSEGSSFLRVDFYEIEGRLYFVELTLFSCSGMVPFYPERWDSIIGNWLEIRSNKRGSAAKS